MENIRSLLQLYVIIRITMVYTYSWGVYYNIARKVFVYIKSIVGSIIVWEMLPFS